ncbi:hypothetical protein D918_02083 [Trichuris suis]|nr:hypothetical protein D918_02083 [Trichuris suis]
MRTSLSPFFRQRFMEDFEEKQFSTADSCILDKHLSLEHYLYDKDFCVLPSRTCLFKEKQTILGYGPFRRRSSNGIFNKINLIAQFGHFE